MSALKPIRISTHARAQMILRGASESEVIEAIRTGEWKLAKRGKQETIRRYSFGRPSPVNEQVYRFKIVNPIFSPEPNEIVVITVKVYYSNEEQGV